MSAKNQSMLEARILLLTDKDAILTFERARIGEGFEAEMASWSARWRPESLDHYLPQGWSFGVFDNGQLQGYVLAQPVLFHRGHTQTLWIERLSYATQEAGFMAVDTVYRWARDKHFQCLLIETDDVSRFILEEWKQAKPLESGLIELRSAKY